MILSRLISFLILMPTIIIHEFSHAFTANRLGDPSAKYAGRLTLNPLAHIDPIGTIIVPLTLIISGSPIMFGWAKPVPYNPLNLRNYRKDTLIVALAGPLSNFLLAITAASLYHLLPLSLHGSLMINLLIQFSYLNVLLGVFNLIPIPPLDGSRILVSLLPPPYDSYLSEAESYGFIVLLLFLLSPISGYVFSFAFVTASRLLFLPSIF